LKLPRTLGRAPARGQKTALRGHEKAIRILAGQYADAETGLHYNYHRYYDPGTGRYLTADPIGLEGGINPYLYVGDSPVNFIDPLGLQGGSITYPNPIGIDPSVHPVFQPGTPENDNIVKDVENYIKWNLTLPWKILAWIADNGKGECGKEPTTHKNNPYDGPVEDPVIVVDPQGNAIPVDRGEQIQTSPDGQWVDVKDSDGRTTGTQIHGPHKPTTHGNQPDALKPHAHRPGNPGGNHWLPLY
jgi:RHS repeat-associated protein